jgi:phage-related protein
MEDLNKTENQGLKGFLVTVFVWVERIRNLFRGIMGGFEAGIALARPAIAAFKEVLESLGNSFGKLFGENDPQKNASSWEKWGAIGQRVGMAFAYIFNLVLKVIVTVLKVVDGIVQGFDWVRLGAEILWDALSQLGTQLQSSINHLFGVSDATGEASTGWETFGKVISWVVGAILSTIGVLVSVISAAFSIISAAIEIVKSVVLSFADIFMGVVSLIDGIITGDWSKIWLGMKQVAFGVVNGIIAVLMELVGAVAGVVDAFAGLFGKDLKLQDGVRGFKDFVSNEMQKDMGIENDTVTGVRPVVSRVPVPSGTVDATPAATIASMTPVSSGYGAAPAVPAADTGPKGPTVINLQVDGQKLAQVVHSADRDSAGRSFSPVPVY